MNSRITIDPLICHGNPVVRKTRILISNILADLAAGQSFEEIKLNYPAIEEEDIKAALEFSSELTNFDIIPYEPQAI